ncbi:Metal-sulfur cluster biosynthetic enzyme [Thermoflavifilum thermophilum]|uniref:Metal-sulfur cluster biosynthetic enzyme n=2 Tax=Thermoflavifilum thermophilum TaxID=1393122 RepID=A0A1I7MYY4_9BACT|nr:Metal-sulfur cluster biosynthetic enzyme [Thermoflavifilum thermophilum]
MLELSIQDPHFNEKMLAIDALHQVIDPELFVNIIDLGLVYDLDFSQSDRLVITMTFSTPHCPLGEAIEAGIHHVLAPLFPDRKIEVNIVWEPPWDFSMMTDEGRRQLGIEE